MISIDWTTGTQVKCSARLAKVIKIRFSIFMFFIKRSSLQCPMLNDDLNKFQALLLEEKTWNSKYECLHFKLNEVLKCMITANCWFVKLNAQTSAQQLCMECSCTICCFFNIIKSCLLKMILEVIYSSFFSFIKIDEPFECTDNTTACYLMHFLHVYFKNTCSCA